MNSTASMPARRGVGRLASACEGSADYVLIGLAVLAFFAAPASAAAASGTPTIGAAEKEFLPVHRAVGIAYSVVREAGIEAFSLQVGRQSGGWAVTVWPIPGGLLRSSCILVSDDETWRVTSGSGRLQEGESGRGMAGGPQDVAGERPEREAIEAIALGVARAQDVRILEDDLLVHRLPDAWRLEFVPPRLSPRRNVALLVHGDGTVQADRPLGIKGFDDLARVRSYTALARDGHLVSQTFYVYGRGGCPEHSVTHMGSGETWFNRLAPDGTSLATRVVDPTGRTLLWEAEVRDEAGRTVERTERSCREGVDRRRTYQYDSAGNLAGERLFRGDGALIETVSYTYDEAGQRAGGRVHDGQGTLIREVGRCPWPSDSSEGGSSVDPGASGSDHDR